QFSPVCNSHVCKVSASCVLSCHPILHQLANALFHLGSVGIVHADLKSGNIMVVNRHESPVKVKVIDFGLAHPASALIPGHRLGTVGYCAPEVMLGIPCDEAIDMWALGLVAVELATGVPLYPGEDNYDVLRFITETQGQLPDHLLDSEQFQYETDYQSKETRYIKLIKQMLALDANQRITPSEVLKHPFFNTGLSGRAPCTDMNTWFCWRFLPFKREFFLPTVAKVLAHRGSYDCWVLCMYYCTIQ
uniref:Protein kinase domain-containing protein n=1 Tax=Maylandia zebra TaxID=106582 RepID=A0A3P9CQF6_9CICH